MLDFDLAMMLLINFLGALSPVHRNVLLSKALFKITCSVFFLSAMVNHKNKPTLSTDMMNQQY